MYKYKIPAISLLAISKLTDIVNIKKLKNYKKNQFFLYLLIKIC